MMIKLINGNLEAFKIDKSFPILKVKTPVISATLLNNCFARIEDEEEFVECICMHPNLYFLFMNDYSDQVKFHLPTTKYGSLWGSEFRINSNFPENIAFLISRKTESNHHFILQIDLV